MTAVPGSEDGLPSYIARSSEMDVTLGMILLFSAVYCDAVELRGTGATFPYSVYQKWMPSFTYYRRDHQEVVMTYNATGSTTGRRSIMGLEGPEVDYGASDTALSNAEFEAYPDLQMLPTMAGAVAIAYNLPEISEVLNLTRESIVGIYNGTIKYWNDSAIQECNIGVHLPYARILPLARFEKSGTTYLFTSALADFSDEFSAKYGTFSVSDGFEKDVIYLRGKTTRGIAGLMLSIDHTVAYFSVAETSEYGIATARVQNKQGQFVYAYHENIQAAMDFYAGTLTKRLTGSLTDADARNAYPIAGYTYLIIRMTGMKDCVKAVELYRYIEWFLTSEKAKEDCLHGNMVPISDVVSKRVLTVLSNFSCHGKKVLDLVADQKQKESDVQLWVLPVAVSLPIGGLIIVVIATTIAYRDYKLGRMLQDSSWKINSENIQITGSSPPRISRAKTPSTNQLSISESNRCLWGNMDGSTVVLRLLETKVKTLQRLSKKNRLTLHMMKNEMSHLNLAKFYGLTEFNKQIYLLEEYSSRGTLEDALYEDSELDDIFKFSLAIDVATAFVYLHRREVVHGSLTAKKCIIDNKWTCKVADWEMNHLRHMVTEVDDIQNVDTKSHFSHFSSMGEVMHPETVSNPDEKLTKASDTYSLSILVYEIFTRRYLLSCPPEEDLYSKMQKISEEPLIDYTMYERVPSGIRMILRTSLAINPKDRPAVEKIQELLTKNNPSDKAILDCILEKLEKKTVELKVHMENFEKLLYEMLPRSVAEKLTSGETIEPEWYDEVTVYFSDIVGFTNISASSTPMEVVDFLNDLYTTFDAILDKFDCYKVETIGDAYMIVSGLPRRNGSEHAVHIANLSIDIAAASSVFRIRHRPGVKLAIRIGLHSGPVAAGVVGVKMPRYCLFGDTVNTASRMESTSVAMKIQVSETTKDLLEKQGGHFILKQRGVVNVKGKGEMKTYWLHGRKGALGQMAPEFCRDIPDDEPIPKK